MSAPSGKKNFLGGFLTIVASLALAVSLIGAGFAACLPSSTTQYLSQKFSTGEASPFSQEQLLDAAMATHSYTVQDNDLEALYNTLYEIGEPYALDSEAISHLDDVYMVVTKAKYILLGIALLGLACFIALGMRSGKKAVCIPFIGGAVGVVIFFLAVGIWALVDFASFFAFIHSLFFAKGTWTFPSDSLLISMYPIGFWMGMGKIWLATTLAGCVLCLAGGLLLRKTRSRPHDRDLV